MYEPEQANHADAHECVEWCPICRGAEILRATASPELVEQLQQLQRGALVSMRELIDAYLQQLDDQPAEGAATRTGNGAEPPTESAHRAAAADPRSSG